MTRQVARRRVFIALCLLRSFNSKGKALISRKKVHLLVNPFSGKKKGRAVPSA